ncbi:MAG: RNase P subunit p30 family protein [Halobacteriales archaeon]
MYEAVHARPDGASTLARMAATAADCGFDGVVVRNHGGELADYDAGAIEEQYGVDVVDGVEIRADSASRAGGLLGSHRPERTVVLVHGGDPEINRFAVESEAVDVLAHPMAGEGDVNHVIAEAAAEHGVALELDLSGVLRASGGERARAIADLRKLRELIEHAGAPYVVSADPRSHLQMRAPRELVAVGEVVGFDREAIEAGLAEWEQIAKRNRERLDPDYVAPGVWRGDGEAGFLDGEGGGG